MRKIALTFSLAAICAITSVLLISIPKEGSAAESNQTIRFYKINNKEQADRINFTAAKARKSGCHNFIRKVRVHRAVPFGYQYCSVYSAKNCTADSVVPAVRDKEPDQPQTKLTQGFSWYPVDEHKRGARLKSWSCE